MSAAVDELVIGADGYIGAHLARIAGARGTTRRAGGGEHLFLDLLDFREAELPAADRVYICAGVNGAMPCEGNARAYRINVDATIRLAQHYSGRGGFVVWIGSTTVEWSSTAYARHKLTTETVLRTMPGVAVVRAGRVVNSNVEDLCRTMLGIGRDRLRGVHLWGAEEPAYAR